MRLSSSSLGARVHLAWALVLTLATSSAASASVDRDGHCYVDTPLTAEGGSSSSTVFCAADLAENGEYLFRMSWDALASAEISLVLEDETGVRGNAACAVVTLVSRGCVSSGALVPEEFSNFGGEVEGFTAEVSGPAWITASYRSACAEPGGCLGMGRVGFDAFSP